MKITAQEEYGVRILLRIARCIDSNGMSIPQLSEAEGITPAYAAKITRKLRIEGYINSTPGNKGGYVLAKPASFINMNEVLKTLGGPLFNKSFCGGHSGALKLCTNSVDCSVRSLWQMIQLSVDQLLDKVTLSDLIGSEEKSENLLIDILEQNFKNLSFAKEEV
ncbi:MAG TPA: Rrf2 family transcriptional regulator [Chitinophagaceae bacterium]|nr:Rrf2 family transcriptional regulator [Chitinophagaceae bacterium]